jgi:signal peptidase complex subunit 3
LQQARISNVFDNAIFFKFFFQTVIHKLQLNALRSLKSHGGVDRALLSFDIYADMTPAFHWNIKQLFVYVVASYKSETNPKNQIVIWDKIVEATDENKIINVTSVYVKYALVDQFNELRGKDIQLQLHWDHMPITGLLYMGKQDADSASSFTLPSEYQ